MSFQTPFDYLLWNTKEVQQNVDEEGTNNAKTVVEVDGHLGRRTVKGPQLCFVVPVPPTFLMTGANNARAPRNVSAPVCKPG